VLHELRFASRFKSLLASNGFLFSVEKRKKIPWQAMHSNFSPPQHHTSKHASALRVKIVSLITALGLIFLLIALFNSAISPHSRVAVPNDLDVDITNFSTPKTSASHFDDDSVHVIDGRPHHIIWRGVVYRVAERSNKAKIDPASVSDAELETAFSPRWNLFAGIAFVCVFGAALAAGLTLGLVSIDPFDLELILHTNVEDCETEEEKQELLKEKQYAERLMPLVQRHHLLLVTLLLLNSICNEALPLFLDRLVPSYIAVILSVTFVLIFGEILPSAIFTGQNQLKFAAFLAPLIYFVMFVFFLIAYPIAWILDLTLGVDEVEHYRRGELKALVKLHAHAHNIASSTSTSDLNNYGSSITPDILTRGKSSESPQNGSGGYQSGVDTPRSRENSLEFGLSRDEITIIHGALEIKNVTVSDIMVEWDKVFMLNMDTQLNYDILAQMIAAGHSRIPIYEQNRNNIRGLLLVKKLIVISPEDSRSVRSLGLRKPLFITPDHALLDVLNVFQQGKSHLAIICADPAAVEMALKKGEEIPANIEMHGILTLEDVLERLIKEEITDETDAQGGVKQVLLEKSQLKRKITTLRAAILKQKGLAVSRVASSEIRRINAVGKNTRAASVITTHSSGSSSGDNKPASSLLSRPHTVNYGAISVSIGDFPEAKINSNDSNNSNSSSQHREPRTTTNRDKPSVTLAEKVI
jgi:metal transporter CNNM